MTDFWIKQNDRLSALAATLKDTAGVAVDISGATVKFNMMLDGSTTTKISSTSGVTIVSSTAGTVSYAWSTGATDTIGLFKGEFEVTFGSGLTQTFPNNSHIDIQVFNDIA